MKKIVVKLFKYVLRGSILGNFIANITYVILYILNYDAGSNLILQLVEDNNYIKMTIYASLSGIFLYVPSIIYEIFKNKIEELGSFNVSKQKYVINYFLLLTVISICMLLFHKVQQIYVQEEFNILYSLLIIVILIIKVSAPVVINIPSVVRQEVDWLNENLKNRNKD